MNTPNPLADPSTVVPSAVRPASRRTWSIAFWAAVVHFVVYVSLMFYTMHLGMERFDFGTPPTLVERVSYAGWQALSLPLVPLLLQVVHLVHLRDPGAWGWLIPLANSACWGLAVYGIVAVRRRRAARKGIRGRS